jgi:hypothetical protein
LGWYFKKKPQNLKPEICASRAVRLALLGKVSKSIKGKSAQLTQAEQADFLRLDEQYKF